MLVLFVSCKAKSAQLFQDAAVRYRCYNFAEALLNMTEAKADVVHISEVSEKVLSRYDVVIFHRPRMSLRLRLALRYLSKARKLAIADFDDLLFDERHADSLPPVVNHRSSEKVARKSLLQYAKALRLFAFATVSTEPLKEHALACFPALHVAVIPNGLSARWIAQGELRQSSQPPQTAGKNCVIRYFPGTSSHDSDFQKVRPVLIDLLHARPWVRLEIIGPLKIDRRDFPANQLIQKPAVHYDVLASELQAADITLAPLCFNPFNRCKSSLKFFESAVWQVPVIATPIPDMERLNGPGLYFAANDDEWAQQLAMLTESSQERLDAGREARQRVLECCTASISTQLLINTTRSWLS